MKTKIKSDSVAIKILRAAISLSEGGVGVQIFSANDLVMRAWEMYPIDFSIHPHPHPDSNRVLSACMGKRGLVSLGFLRLVSPKVYAVTEAGYARAPSEPVPIDGPQQARDAVTLARRHLRFLAAMECSNAVNKRTRRERVSLIDALEFWQIDGGATIEQIRGRLSEIKQAFMDIETLMPEDSTEAKRTRVMRHFHEDLLATFERSLGLRQARKPNNQSQRQYHYA